MKLLIVNDEILTADTLKAEIPWHQYGIREVFLAYDAGQARSMIQTKKIDILLCDIEMPGEDGISLLRWVREEQFELECVFLTCHANFSYAQEAVKLECQDYVLMPARDEEIGRAVQEVVLRLKEKREKQKLAQYGQCWLQKQKESAYEMQGDKKEGREIIGECMQFILENLENADLSVNSVASHCCLNPIYLNRIFKKEKGISIGQMIIREKMALAAKLLKGTDLNAGIVAVKVGYPNYPHFSTAFKKYYGCSPQQFKEN